MIFFFAFVIVLYYFGHRALKAVSEPAQQLPAIPTVELGPLLEEYARIKQERDALVEQRNANQARLALLAPAKKNRGQVLQFPRS